MRRPNILTRFANRLMVSVRRRSRQELNMPHVGALRRHFRRTQGMTSYDEASLLYELAKATKVGCIIEVGSYRGRSTVALGRGSLDGHRAPVYAIDPHEEFIGVLGGVFGPEDRAAFYRAMLDTGCYEVVRLINLSSEIVVPNWTKPVSLLWIDGDHSYEGVKRDFDCWSPHLTADATVVFDDSLDPTIGPLRLIQEMLQTKLFEKADVVGKVTALKKRPR
jgi:predicted O-methyltransferase YrrM